jgi:AcrR family transcriptional regulator
MPRRPVRGRPRAPTLSRERILRCAIRLADEKGIEALSMRTLADRLGVQAMSLYNHVANKDDILSGIVDLVVSAIETPTVGSDWKLAMRRRAISARKELLHHPWMAALMESRRTPSAGRLRYADSILGGLRAAGFPIKVAWRAFLTLDSYIYGFTLQETSWPYPPDEVPAAVERLRSNIPSSEYPHVRDVIAVVMARRTPLSRSRAAEFTFGLDLIIEGLERQLTTHRSA